MATEKRLIDANALAKAIDIPANQRWFNRKVSESSVNWARYFINNATTEDAAPVVHGRWIPIIDEPTQLRRCAMLSGYKCSVCGRYENEEEPYCNCGAKMDDDGNG